MHGKVKLAEFVCHFNNGQPNIKLTIDTSEDKGHIDYMYVTLHITASGEIYKLFQKSCNSGLLIGCEHDRAQRKLRECCL